MSEKFKYTDKASRAMIAKAGSENVEIVWDRYKAMQPQCGFGLLGICCHICSMGPCRIAPFGDGPRVGVCGAGPDTIAARNLARMIAGGASAHSDHGREIAFTLLKTAEDPDCGFSIKDEQKLHALAVMYGVNTAATPVVARELACEVLNEFGRQKGELKIAAVAPKKRIKLWRNLGIMPRSIDREVVELMHRTTMGVDEDYKNIIRQGMRTAIADGWGGSMIATELSDVLFGCPRPLRSQSNLGVLKENEVNVVIHGHNPLLPDVIAHVSQSKELLAKAQQKGAQGINIAGICCTANEILMRRGIPLAGSFLQQELAIMTGAVDIMIVDVQCLLPALKNVTGCFHTKLVTTSPKARMDGVDHIEFDERNAVQTATKILDVAINNYPFRERGKVNIPLQTNRLISGFSTEEIRHILGGTYRSSFRPLNDAIISGRLRGAAGVIGCSNPNVDFEKSHLEIVRELIKNDTIVVSTGCNAITCAKHGLLKPESAFEYAGKGLQEVCRAIGIPPVLHLGSCVDNSRILTLLSQIVAEGGLGEDLSDLPVAGAAPEWMSEKAVTIGFYFVASGIYTVIGHPLPVLGGEKLYKYLTEEIETEVGGCWAFEPDPVKAAHHMLRHIDGKREKLKLRPVMFEQDFPPEG